MKIKCAIAPNRPRLPNVSMGVEDIEEDKPKTDNAIHMTMVLRTQTSTEPRRTLLLLASINSANMSRL